MDGNGGVKTPRLRCMLIAVLCSVGLNFQVAAAECKRQRLPPAIESAGLPPSEGYNNIITFAATPSLDYPGRAWVIRLFQRTRSQPATLTIVRLLSRNDCNVYDVESRWEAPLRADEYEALATLIEPYVMAPPGIFSKKGVARDGRVVVDGTGLDLLVETPGWQIRRSLNLGVSEGAKLSAIFHRLLAPVVPAPERPGESWSMTRR